MRREGRTASAEPVCSCASFYLPLHMRPRVQRAPGLPCALFFSGRMNLQNSGECCRENAESHQLVVPANAGTHTPCVLVSAMWRMPSFTIHARGDGSRPAPGRRGCVIAIHTSPRSRDSIRPSFANSFRPQKNRGRSATLKRGRREDRVRAAPAVSCAKVANRNAHEHTGSAEAVRPSLRNGFTTYSVLSPVRP